MSTVPVKGADAATYQLALTSLGSTPAGAALSVIPSPDGTHAKTADITALSTTIVGALAATMSFSMSGTAAVTQSGAWTVGLANGATVALLGGNTVALKIEGTVDLKTGALVSAQQSGAWNVGLVNGAQVGISSLPALVAGTAKIGSVDVANLDAVTGTDGVSPPAITGTGIRGWLRAIYERVAGTLTVSGTVGVNNFPASQAVTGPLTDAQLRATALPVGGTVSIGNFPATQAVSGTMAISNALALDATITARLGTLGQKTAAASAPVVIASDQGAVQVAPAAGENHLGSVGGDSKRSTAAPVLTPSTYANGKCLGGLVTLASLLRVAGKSATVQSASIHAKVANTAQIDVVLFRDTPTITTGLTDNATFAVDPADFDKVSKVISFTTWSSLGTPSLSRIDGIGSLISAANGVDMKAILVARGPIAIATASDLTVGLGVYQD